MAVKDIFSTYLQALYTRYEKEDADKVMIVKTGFLIYPVLKEMGFGSTGSVALVTDTISDREMAMRDLSGVSEYSLFPITILPKEIKRLITNAEYELLAFTYTRGLNSISNLEMLQASCYAEMIPDHKFVALPIITFCGGIPDDAKGLLSGQISIQAKGDATLAGIYNSDSGVNFSRVIIEFICCNWATLQMEISRLSEDGTFQRTVLDNPGVGMFFIAEKLLELVLECNKYSLEEREKLALQWQSSLESIVNEWQIISDGLSWLEVLYNMIRGASMKIPGILDRNQLMACDIVNAETWPLYDDRYYYLSSNMFDELCMPITELISLRQIKGLLTESGILIGEGKERQYMTIKVPIVTEYGAILQQRKIRLCREWLDPVGELTWKEMIEANVESEED
jgi:hypothetical protein